MPDGPYPRPRPGLLVRRDRTAPDERTVAAGLAVTSPLRTAYDLARRRDTGEAVVAVDALARRCGFAPRDLLVLHHRHLGARGSRQLPWVVALADPRAASPAESRLRFALVVDGLPAAVPGLVVTLPDGTRHRVALAWPGVRLALECLDAGHAPDPARTAAVGELGWRLLAVSPRAVRLRPCVVAARVARALDVTPARSAPPVGTP